MKVKLYEKDALIIVDLQKDFCPGGALPVPDGDKVVPVINKYIELFSSKNLPVVATRDWHPSNHCSFKEFGGQWPPHCIKNTPGAEFHPDLKLPDGTKIISKATSRFKEAYSGFEGTKLKNYLKRLKRRRLFIGGLATDYCVKMTVLDALRFGFIVFLLLDGSKGVDVNPDDSEKAIEEMLSSGAIGIELYDLS
jgi:nicotinamidase/pyrazinamidase